MSERLQKVLARAGFGSRRSAELLITQGHVRVNGHVVTELGTRVDPGVDRIEVDGVAIEAEQPRVYLAMNKPYGVVTTARDPQRRHTVMELLPKDLPPHVLPVGRLDRDTQGLLLFTNDGELAHRLAHPRYRIDKEYQALVAGQPRPADLERLQRGVVIEGRTTAPAGVDVSPPPYGFNHRDEHTWLRLVLHEGRKRQVRLMCAAIGHPVRTLVRTRIGEVLLGRLAPGKSRTLGAREVAHLRGLTGLRAASVKHD